jgi:hypothetical protein
MDLLNSLLCGRRVTAHGETWVVLQHLPHDLLLAAKESDTFPALVHLLRGSDTTAVPSPKAGE